MQMLALDVVASTTSSELVGLSVDTGLVKHLVTGIGMLRS